MSHSAMSWRRSLLALVVIAVLPLATLVAGGANAAAIAAPGRYQAAASGWSLQDVPAPSAAGGTLTAVSCGGPRACMTVGSYTDLAGTEATLAEAWNGHTWSVVSTPNPGSSSATSLSAVSCPAAGFCVAAGTWTSAAGQSYPLAERWQGGRWSTLTMPNPVTSTDTVLTGVACTSATACIAVGYFVNPYFTQTLAEAWNGHGWSVQQTKNVPNPTSLVWGELNGIWCRSAKACTAVGSYQGSVTQLTLAESWNGKTWSVQASPNMPGEAGNDLSAVSCRSARQCVAAGDYSTSTGATGPLAEAWNGRAWSVERTPAPSGAQDSYLNGAVCPSASVCLAVGYTVTGSTSRTLAEQWNGHTWSIKSAPPPAGSAQSALSGIWCRSARACVAVGTDTDSVTTRTLALTWTGSAWSVTPTAGPAGVLASDLSGVSCTATDDCVAVGYYIDVSGTWPLTELWNGKAWSVVPAPSPAGTVTATLSAVTCVAAGNCVAVGSYYNGTATLTLAEAWNGKHWSVSATPKVAGAQGSVLSAVSCAASGHCMAVGSYSTSAVTGTLAETWNGTAWSISKTPDASGSSFTSLSAVSCPAVNRCIAVGGYVTVGAAQPAIAETWNGSSWTVKAVPGPANAPGTFLLGLDCRSADDCTAVGNYFNGTGNAPLAEGWNGTAWSVQSTPAPASPIFTTLNAVSCPGADDCEAAGYNTTASATTTLGAAWNGQAWAIQPTPNASGAQQSYLNGVSCPQSGSCAAVGDYDASAISLPVPLAARYQG